MPNPPYVSQSSEVVAFNKYQRASGVFLSLFTLLCISVFAALGCSGSASNTVSSSGLPPTEQVVAPVFTITPEQNGAVLITLSDSAANANIYYSLDGSTPTSASPQYIAPFLVAWNTTVQAIGIHGGETNSPVSNKTFSPNIASGTLVWSEEFDNTTGANAQPNPAVWTYDTGAGGWGNGELENYCAWGSSTVPCNSTKPNEYVGTDGYLHIVAQQPSAGVYTSSRLKTQGLFSFQYGRLEFRAQVPEARRSDKAVCHLCQLELGWTEWCKLAIRWWAGELHHSESCSRWTVSWIAQHVDPISIRGPSGLCTPLHLLIPVVP